MRRTAPLSTVVAGRGLPSERAGGPQATLARDATGAEGSFTTWLFCGYLLLLFLEYSGIPRNLVPILHALKTSTVLSYVLLLAVLAQGNLGDLLRHRQTKILLTIVAFTAASMIWAVVTIYAFETIREMVDGIALFILTAKLVDRRQRIDALSWTFVGVCTYLIARNVDKLFASVRSGSFIGGYFMGDGNDFGWALVVMLPIIANLLTGRRSVISRLGGLLGAACCLIGIVGTSSRGATLGLVAMAIYYLVAISRHKAFGILALVGIVGAVLILAPTSYLDRMQSVGHIEQDNSSRARLQAWGAATRMALDYPLGVGANNFPSAYGRYYIPSDDENAISWRSRRWISAHSIYFRMLAEYGVLGLGLLLWLILTNFRDNVAARKRIAAGSEAAPIQAIWPGLVTTAVVGHAVSGAFLAGLTYPHLFLLCGLTIGCKRFAESIVDPPPPGKSSSQQRTEPSRYASYPR